MPKMALMVMTPVPPMPTIRMLQGAVSAGTVGGGTSGASAMGATRRNSPPSTVTKLGQKPSRHDRSTLQDDWSICRLLPNGVSTGITAAHCERSTQSPQPSQTAVLMNGRRVAGAISPRFRRRRFSVAQVWS